MGYRYTLISEHTHIDWPEWFVNKHEHELHISNSLIASKHEGSYWVHVLEDVKAVLRDIKPYELKGRTFHGAKKLVLVAMSEDYYLTKIVVTKDEIRYYGGPSFNRVNDLNEQGGWWPGYTGQDEDSMPNGCD